ncbi:hypothetical protein ZIOFF_035268 [Zingiber officinale]|uniref:Uncharacterized protein n=1 Tax=Zingiber officinale TaxID=94328 RepID=A0A8J5GEE9_ZINOF|nr:hypothetical protein ZIOFF_035268 [Zingiber officinale]
MTMTGGASLLHYTSDDSNFILLSTSSDLVDDVTNSSPSSSSMSSFDLSSLSLEAKLPVKRGLYRFFEGKSKSFRCLPEVRCIEDLAKLVTPSRKRSRHLGSMGSI